MKGIILSLLLTLSLEGHAQVKVTTKVAKLGYVSSMFAQLYSGPNRDMEIYTTLECGHPVKILSRSDGKTEEMIFGRGWYLIKAAGHEGFVQARFVSESKVTDCFNQQYPKYYDALNLTISEMYYWGRLKNVYNYGESKAVGDNL